MVTYLMEYAVINKDDETSKIETGFIDVSSDEEAIELYEVFKSNCRVLSSTSSKRFIPKDLFKVDSEGVRIKIA